MTVLGPSAVEQHFTFFYKLMLHLTFFPPCAAVSGGTPVAPCFLSCADGMLDILQVRTNQVVRLHLV